MRVAKRSARRLSAQWLTELAAALTEAAELVHGLGAADWDESDQLALLDRIESARAELRWVQRRTRQCTACSKPGVDTVSRRTDDQARRRSCGLRAASVA